ncbi:tRNA 2-selenouridine(34) synthase MnmH [Alkalibacter mobilis]|uniref:tRNA 2-selenouridine(34) synthase MnmH n=1 Tax=Alkalibacter mobilis TaxID=2787712 RepID=UPI0018A10F00|nr:tRNA 2-selenouridine(34) synthase MnmH [Alkalibacter mobilis]MBF7097615.1 tRNA 2-selenouridine(34) synthase MnmH [Alkalibacter mobilis]
MDITATDFESIVVKKIPLIDLRAPIEFLKGSFPNAVNLPLMNDEERHQVGICYKEYGNEKATELGHRLVSGAIRESRTQSWIDFINSNPETIVFCFRGGQRSQIAQQWIFDKTNRSVQRIEGGYKAFRKYLIDSLSPLNITSKPLVLTGFTGSGKTDVIEKYKNAIDLEGLANHRGSSFGGNITEQPTQINFENNLAYKIIQHKNQRYRYMLIEDESRNIGRSYLPRDLHDFLKSNKYVLLEVEFEKRIENIHREYVIVSQKMYESKFGKTEGLIQWQNNIISSLERIRKRLGNENFIKIREEFDFDMSSQLNQNEKNGHKAWIELLLKDYYDPMYMYQIEKKQDRIVFKGSLEAVEGFLSEMESELI